MKPELAAAKQTMHKMTAEVQLVASVDTVDHKSGAFGGIDCWQWSMRPESGRKASLPEWTPAAGAGAVPAVAGAP